MTLLEQAMAPDTLNLAWKRLRNEHTPWSEHINRNELQWDLMRHILELREDVLTGNYRPSPLRRFTMKKPDGRKRILSAQYLRDKLVQRALLIVLEPRAEAIFHEDSYAYRPGRGVPQALARTKERIRYGLDWLVDADIRQFFDSIPLAPLKKQLRGFVNDRQTMRLIDAWLEKGMHNSSILGTRRGIAQGAILSPLMCNLYLHQFDQMLTRNNIPFVRFADDFLLFCADKKRAEKAMETAKHALEKLDLRLHPKKTRVIRSNPGARFLGERLPQPSR